MKTQSFRPRTTSLLHATATTPKSYRSLKFPVLQKSSQEGVLHCNVSYLQTPHLRNPPKKECYTATSLTYRLSHLRNPPKKECYTATSLTYRLITPSKSPKKECYTATFLLERPSPFRSSQEECYTSLTYRKPSKSFQEGGYTATSLTYRLFETQEGVLQSFRPRTTSLLHATATTPSGPTFHTT